MVKTRLVLVGTEGEINLGMIARLAENFDVDELYLVNPQADIEAAKEYAVHAFHRLDDARIVDTLEESLENTSVSICTTAVKAESGDLLRVTTPLSQLPPLLEKISGRIAIVFGRESVGLTRDELSKCDLRATIETSDRYRTMNLACSVAVTLYTIYNTLKRVDVSKPSIRTGNQKRRLALNYASRIAENIFRDEQRRTNTILLFKKILTPGFLEDPEASLLLTFLSRIHSRLKRG